MGEKDTPYICGKCGENLLAKGVACSSCNKLLCPVCDCAYTVDYYCYCTDCKQMVANKFAVIGTHRPACDYPSDRGD